jgi:hypothetical protein
VLQQALMRIPTRLELRRKHVPLVATRAPDAIEVIP